MKISEFFDRLKKEFNISPYEYCQIKDISYPTLKKYIDGHPIPHPTAVKIHDMTAGNISMEEMGF